MAKAQIFVVQAQGAALDQLQAMLAKLGHESHTAQTGAEALRLAEAQRPDLVLMDLALSGIDGLDALTVAERIHRLRIPVICLTSLSEESNQQQLARQANPFGFLLKPIAEHDLDKTIEIALYKSSIDRQLEEVKTKAEESHQRLSIFSETASQLNLTDRPQDVLPGLIKRVATHLDLPVYLIYLLSEDAGQMRLFATSGLPEDLMQEIELLPCGETICGTLHQGHAHGIVIEELTDSAPGSQLLRSLGFQSCACYPMMARDRLVGTMTFASRERPHFAPEALDLLHSVGAELAMALDRSSLMVTLQRRADELAEADRHKDDFLAMLAHELRNPLTPILSALEVMRLRGFENPAQKHSMDIVERQAQHMARLLDDLLDVARIARGKIELRRETVELTTIIAQVVESTLPIINSRKHKFSIQLPPEAIWLEADVTRLQQILTNLLSNAAKYTEMGGNITLEVERTGSEVELRVRDSGIGIPPEMLPHIFELFTQVDRHSERAQGGLGIGLTMVKRLVEMHHGRVLAHSDGEGKGSEFIVRLPVQTRTQAPLPDETSPRGGSQRRRRRILVVEDNVDSAKSLAELLDLWGHEVRIAYDGPMAIQMAKTYQPEVVLLDIGLPGINGYQVTQALRQNADFTDTLIIAVTGYGQSEDLQLAREVGINHHITKPVDFAALETLLA